MEHGCKKSVDYDYTICKLVHTTHDTSTKYTKSTVESSWFQKTVSRKMHSKAFGGGVWYQLKPIASCLCQPWFSGRFLQSEVDFVDFGINFCATLSCGNVTLVRRGQDAAELCRTVFVQLSRWTCWSISFILRSFIPRRNSFAVGRYPPIFSPLGMCSLADAGEDHTTQRMGPDVSLSCKVSSLFCCHFDKFVRLQPLQPLWNNPFNMLRLCFHWHAAL